MAQRVEGARLDKRLDHTLVADLNVDLGQEVAERLVASCALASRLDGLDDIDPYIAHRRHAESDVGTHWSEVGLGLVDIWRKDLDAKPTALVEVDRRLLFVVFHARQ